jgi:hypothetical protein
LSNGSSRNISYDIAHDSSIRNAKDFTFTRRKLINWLRYNHKPYVKRYEQRPLGSENEEKISLEKTVRRSLGRLVELELFQVVGQERISTGTSTTPIYKYTVFGYLIALIIQPQIIDDAIVQGHHESTERKSRIVDKIYNVFLEIVMKGSKHAPSTYISYSKFFEICKQRGLFGDIVSLLKQIVGSDINIITIKDLMHRLMEIDFKDSENSKLFFRLL